MKVFISHSSSDKKFVRTLKDDLNENGIETWLDEDELELGDTLADKLEIALEQSSHFLIILSPASVNSEWVQYELRKALKQKNANLLQKIIPIKYRECLVPDELSHLIHSDLSHEIRQIQGDRVFFHATRYSTDLARLCKAIKNSDKLLNEGEKLALRAGIVPNTQYPKASQIIKATYNVIGYKNSDARLYFSNIIQKHVSNSVDSNIIKPILLPPLLKSAFKSLKIGDNFEFSKDYQSVESGQFAGYRNDDLAITIDARIRKALDIVKGNRYNVEVDPIKKTVNFLDIAD